MLAQDQKTKKTLMAKRSSSQLIKTTLSRIDHHQSPHQKEVEPQGTVMRETLWGETSLSPIIQKDQRDKHIKLSNHLTVELYTKFI